MSVEVDHSRRLRAGRQASPALSPRIGTSSAYLTPASSSKDVFGAVATPMRAVSPGGVRGLPSPVSKPRDVVSVSNRKSKGATRAYGDRYVDRFVWFRFLKLIPRFIPVRDGSDMHAAYQLLVDQANDPNKASRRRKSNVGQNTDVEARRGGFFCFGHLWSDI